MANVTYKINIRYEDLYFNPQYCNYINIIAQMLPLAKKINSYA